MTITAPCGFLLLTLLSLPLAAQPYYARSIAAGIQLPATGAAATSIPTGVPLAVAVDSSGRVYYSAANAIFRIDTDGTVTHIAGTGYAGFRGDGGLAVNAELNAPQGIAVDAAGNVFVSDTGNRRVRRIAPSGTIATMPGFDGPVGIAVDKAGNIYAAESVAGWVVRLSPAGLLTIVAPDTLLLYPNGVAADGFGDVFIADSNNLVIRKMAADGTFSTVATGTPRYPLYSSDFDHCTRSYLELLCGPQSVAADNIGNAYFADTFGNKVVRVSDGAAVAINSPASVAVDSTGNVYAVGSDKYVTKVNWSGPSEHIAGNGADPDNNAQTFWAGLGADPLRVKDAAGNVYTADTSHYQVTKTAAGTGVVTVVAGNGSPGFSGDGGPAIQAGMSPTAIALDGAGDLYITDGYRVREVTTGGIIQTVAGNGATTINPGGDGRLAVNVPMTPDAIAADSQGNLFIAAYGTNRVWIAGKDGIIHTIASDLYFPSGLTVDSFDNVYVLDSDNWVFKLTPGGTPPYISAVFDAASEAATPISPGKIIAIYGLELGPLMPATTTPSNGVFGTELAGTTVSINGVAAPVYYASAEQVNAIVPYATTGSTASITVSYNGTVTRAFTVNVAPTSPSLFTYYASGSGQVAAINVRDGTLNTAANPARIGDFISFYATGAGQTSPAGVDGELAPLTLPIPAPAAKVSVTIGGVPAVLNYAGGVPGAVAGLMQINAQIPKGVTPGGFLPVVVTIGDSSTVSDAVWIAVSN